MFRNLEYLPAANAGIYVCSLASSRFAAAWYGCLLESVQVIIVPTDCSRVSRFSKHGLLY